MNSNIHLDSRIYNVKCQCLTTFKSGTSACSVISLCETVCALCLHMVVNKPACRTGRGVMFQLETSTNSPKWMRENGSDSKHVPWGHKAQTFYNILQSWSGAVPERRKLCVFICHLSLIKSARFLTPCISERQRIHDVFSKTINRYVFTLISTLLPLYPQMNPGKENIH